MKPTAILATSSLLSIVLMSFHLAQDILFEFSPARFSNLIALLIFAVWLYGTVVLVDRRSGYIITFLGALLGLGVPVIHMRGSGGLVGGEIGTSGTALFFVWTLLALGATSALSLVLSARALWNLPWRRPR